MASHDESFSTELALMFGNFFGVAEAENLSLDTDSSSTATENFDQTPQANIVSSRQTSLELTDKGTQQAESTTTPNLLAAQTQTSTINVNYNGFSTEAQTAFEYAVDIWENLIVSPVPIEVEANWTPFGTNALGSAGPNDYDYNFANAAYANTLYPSALANSLAGFDLDTTAHDINANFNSDYSNWYFGTDGNAQTGQYDFVSVVLHELGHGLGFLGNMDYDFGTGQGSWWSQPMIYDHFTVNGSGQKLIDTFPNNSVALGAQLTSDNLFFNGSNAVAANGGTNPKLYAPSTWELGSSYAHLDEATYGSGNSNALMTPYIAPGEAHHDPGAVTLGIFEDLGWVINLADLSGSDFDIIPQPLDAGDSFDIDFDITNTGSSAGAFDVSFYLSSNNYISTTDHLLYSGTINGLAGNSTGSFTTSLNLPGVNHSFWDLYGDDTYYIGMQVDSGADVTESNETNNSNVGYLYDYDDVVINNTQLADLSGLDFDVTSEPLDAGDSFDIDFDISNTGSSAGAFDVSFYLSSNNTISTVDQFLGSTTINGLAGNSTGSFTTSLNLPGVNHSFWDLYGDDTYYIGMQVDSGADVTESNETNNSNVGFLFDYDDVAINNTQIANLSGLNFNVTPEPLNAGDSFDIDLAIDNSGAAAAGAFDVSLYLSSDSNISNSDLLLDTISFTGLAANSSGTFTSNFILPEANDAFWSGDGSYHIGMMIDSGDDITETIETDNANLGLMLDTDNVVINNTQLADLVGVDFNLVQEPLAAGDHFDVNFEVQNTEIFAAGAFDVSFYVSTDNTIDTADQFLGSTTINGLAGNSIGAYTTGLTLPGINDSTWNGDGIYYIGMIIDQDGTLAETDETNNSNNGLFVDYDNVLISDTELIGTDDDDILFGTPGDDILSGLRDDDDLVGGGGDDTLFGDRGDDNLFGEAGSDMLFGDRGDDYLFGGTGNDRLDGDRGDDLLIGVELNLANPGLGEVDSLIGGFGADVFQLGDVFSAYYDDANGTTDGSTDYALITDFDINQDIIELHGSAADYQLATVSPSLPSGIGVFLQSSTPSGQDELIGIVQGESSLSLNDSYFSFV
ncbi:MAG: CARDB domain-containing protein [Coleofasciculus sp. C1-SOL-03]|uniref:CARDB domain-containing protein n=1 Tax=Coleofasciculus sp. C1-SOL-03 TaxID=3069522 RepID=UPI0032F1466F